MEEFSIYPPSYKKELRPGLLLVAEPMLSDSNFSRAVVVLCEHSEEGSVGFVLNHPTGKALSDLADGVIPGGPQIYKGGPVQENTLHMLHRLPDLIEGGTEITNGVFWGGTFSEVGEILNAGQRFERDVRLFVGYSGWGPGQLEQEIKEGAWLIVSADEKLLFGRSNENVWKKAIALLGRKYGHLAHMPTDPQLN